MSNGTKKIESLSDFLKEITKIKRETVYRGQSDEGWEVTSGAYRRLKKSPITPNSSELLKYNTELVNKARRHTKELSEKTTDLALLAKLQHYGAATSLIDFTKSALIALWFACQDDQTDGKVFCLDISNQNVSNVFLAISPEEEEKEDLNTILTLKFRDKNEGDKIAKWEPPIDNRTLKQDSFFIFNTTGKLDKFVKELTISKDDKKPILKQLNKLSALSEETVFPDFYGFSQNNAVNKPHGPQDAEEYFLHGNANLTSGKYPEAINDYDQAIALNPQSAGAYNNRGNAKSDLGRHKEAIQDYGQAIALNPQDAIAYTNRGNAKSDLGRREEAIQDYDQAIALNPQYAGAYNDRGVAKSDLGRHKEAINDYDQTIALNPQYAGAYNNRGVAKSDLGRHKEAINDYDQAIALNPQYAGAYNNRGAAKSALGNYKEAIQDYDQAIALNPQYADAYNNRGVAKSDLGNYKETIEDFIQAIALNPQYTNAYYNRGVAKFALGNYKEAIQDYDQAIALNPQYANAYYNRGAAKSALETYKEAITDCNRAKELYELQKNLERARKCAEIIAHLKNLINNNGQN